MGQRLREGSVVTEINTSHNFITLDSKINDEYIKMEYSFSLIENYEHLNLKVGDVVNQVIYLEYDNSAKYMIVVKITEPEKLQYYYKTYCDWKEMQIN